MSMVGFPLLLIPVAIYNIIAFLMPGVPLTEQAEPLFKAMLVSGVEWPVTLRDMLLALGVVMLMFEVIKGARPGAKYLMDHLLSLIVFGAAAAEFVMWPRFGTSTYFLLGLLALVDFLSGIALHTRRRVIAAAAPAVSRKSARKSEKFSTPAEPQFEPTPAQTPAPVAAPAAAAASAAPTSVPAAASVAESVLLDHPAAPSSAAASSASASSASSASSATSPEGSSPGLQPGHSAPPSPDAPR